MGRQFSLEPRNVKLVDTKYRKIKTQIPNPESTSLVRRMRTCEPVSMSGQPVIVWDAAKGCQVYDKSGNCWIDFSSGVVVTNAGHCNPEVQKAIFRDGGTWAFAQLLLPDGTKREARDANL